MTAISTLDCGARLVTERMPGVRSACLGFWVGTGSRDETERQAGISHFLEHLLFKGSPTRSARSIAEEIDAVGGDMNAFTTKEYTTFYLRMLGDDLDLGLDILSDIVWSPALRPDEVASERQVILEEVLMHLDEPSDFAQERFADAMFPSHPLGREVLGDPEIIKTVTVDEIRQFLTVHYRPANVVVAAAGQVDHSRIADGLQSRFAGTPGGAAPRRQAPSAATRPVDVTVRDTEQAHLVLGVRAPARRSPSRFALALLNHVLGGGISSRLFQKIREERGLAYSIVSERFGFADSGALVVSVGTAPDKAHEVVDLVVSEFGALASAGVTAEELARAKGHVAADLLLGLEDSGNRMSRIGAGLLLFDEVLSSDEQLARIAAVSVDEVAALAAEVLDGGRVLAVVGPSGVGEFAPLG
ncbi:MAG: pitrilysin family protein [Acidimicrobiales bacterium]|jgi:predicted Zn-dependent peptidase